MRALRGACLGRVGRTVTYTVTAVPLARAERAARALISQKAAVKPAMAEDDSEVESLLWTCKECYVYQIPPLKNESGHRANDWDVNKWLWSGTIKVTSRGNVLYVLLVDSTTGELFATCPVTEPGSKAIDPVVDSSRYFVLRIDDGKGRHAFIGMGFRDRK